MTAILDIQMPPGNYAVFLMVHVHQSDNPNAYQPLYLFYYMPVIVSTAQGGLPSSGRCPTYTIS
jgi:hypothetical protein